jgi:uncharacterized protein (DUF1800 family)
VLELGWETYLEEQLHPERLPEPRAAWMRLLPLDTLAMDAGAAYDAETAVNPEVGEGQAAVELRQACLLRAVYSARQLQEVMVEFWTDHFNITQLKGECSWLKTVDDRLLRRHALGRFRDLLGASARSAAMLFYLDNSRNRRRDPATGSGPNENYARELLELHTLGVDGGYSLHDIQEVARCFSGWSYRGYFTHAPGAFVFQPEHHDDGPKTVLGHRLPPGGGVRDGEQVLDLLCAHPATARHLSYKLCRRFVADDPPAALVAELAAVFRRHHGELRPMLRHLLRHPEFLHGNGRKLRRSFDYAVAALRALHADTSGAAVLPYLERMGQLPYRWTMPDGYPDRAAAWTATLLPRWNFALDLLTGKIPGTRVDLPALVRATRADTPLALAAAFSRLLLGRTLPSERLRLLVAHAGGEQVPPARLAAPLLSLLLCSPEFQWR